MTFFSFSSSGKKKRKSEKASSRPSTAPSYGYHNSPSTITLYRPVPNHFAVQPYQQSPNGPWNSVQSIPYGQNLVSQPHLPMGPPHQNSIYGQSQGNGAPWASTTSISTRKKLKNKSSSLHLPSAVSGQLHAASKSVSNLSDSLNQMSSQYLNQGAALCDRISSKFDTVITCIDEERFSGDERDLSKFLVRCITEVSTVCLLSN
jgi:hypothetical protein